MEINPYENNLLTGILQDLRKGFLTELVLGTRKLIWVTPISGCAKLNECEHFRAARERAKISERENFYE